LIYTRISKTEISFHKAVKIPDNPHSFKSIDLPPFPPGRGVHPLYRVKPPLGGWGQKTGGDGNL